MPSLVLGSGFACSQRSLHKLQFAGRISSFPPKGNQPRAEPCYALEGSPLDRSHT